jgi:DNA-binding Xre family transcriptional regulator
MRESYVHKGVRYWREVPSAPEAKPQQSFRQVMGEVLREKRTAEKMQLRDIVGVSIGFVSEIERGKKEASCEVLEAICASLNITIPEVLRLVADRLEGKVLVDA